MPTVIVEGPKIDVEKKRELVRRITEVIKEVYEIPHVTVLIKENPPENVGIDGELLLDKKRGEGVD
ncbi:4-oxalocrotonate tautomerase [Palaeococcus pacificus DY20341]|uniref:4-oxalocrotonate tautomerase n=1 Tax=Palaeococcus pacificus DY20341 TaxID=1343739 RepID=A0A075LWD9_9EURY|nr:4-oxalocrotonate tautomerase DmpI [Palaeococcus pacificus]AIF68833.1 4-oxalocrotonate tautomerase [Palaeococcus pacificus DY20341]